MRKTTSYDLNTAEFEGHIEGSLSNYLLYPAEITDFIVRTISLFEIRIIVPFFDQIISDSYPRISK